VSDGVLEGAPGVVGIGGAVARGAEPHEEGRQVVQGPAQPVKGQGGRVDGPAGGGGVAAEFLAGVAGDHPQVPFRRGQPCGVPVDQHRAGACPHEVRAVRLAVGDDRFARRDVLG
jgi:hypothetical protein